MRTLAPSDSFMRDLQKFLRHHRDLSIVVEKVFDLLENDIRSSTLHTHKLHGNLSNSYACKINYQYRTIFSFDEKNVYLKSIGSHDEVY